MANAVLICHHGREGSQMHSSNSEGRSVLLLLNGRIASRSLQIYRSSPSRWCNKIRLSSVHTIVSLSLNADEILDLST